MSASATPVPRQEIRRRLCPAIPIWSNVALCMTRQRQVGDDMNRHRSDRFGGLAGTVLLTAFLLSVVPGCAVTPQDGTTSQAQPAARALALHNRTLTRGRRRRRCAPRAAHCPLTSSSRCACAQSRRQGAEIASSVSMHSGCFRAASGRASPASSRRCPARRRDRFQRGARKQTSISARRPVWRAAD